MAPDRPWLVRDDFDGLGDGADGRAGVPQGQAAKPGQVDNDEAALILVNLLLLADLVLQVNLARKGIRKVFETRSVPPHVAYSRWHPCLRWWSLRVPIGYLVIAVIGWAINRALGAAPDAGITLSGFLFSFGLIMALVAASRLMTQRDIKFDASEWHTPLK